MRTITITTIITLDGDKVKSKRQYVDVSSSGEAAKIERREGVTESFSNTLIKESIESLFSVSDAAAGFTNHEIMDILNAHGISGFSSRILGAHLQSMGIKNKIRRVNGKPCRVYPLTLN